jgi:predicted DNA-binding transcriptional regulator AlpA
MENVFLTSLTLPEVRQLFREELKTYFANHPPFADQNATKIDRGGIEVAERVTGLARQTIYGLVSRRAIPHDKRGKKLYFSEKELEQWIAAGKRPLAGQPMPIKKR